MTNFSTQAQTIVTPPKSDSTSAQTLIGWGEASQPPVSRGDMAAPPAWLVPISKQAPARQTSNDPHALIGKVVGGGYVITALIGSGGMGYVYVANHPKLAGREIAVKVLHPTLASRPDSVARFIGEARSAAALRSPHIIEVHDVGQFENGAHYLLMKHANGGSLDRFIEHEGAMPFDLAFTIIVQVAAALHAAHQHPVAIIHRDVKPQNILLENCKGRPMRAMLADFGVAKLNDGADLTSARAILGSPGYLAPETLGNNGARKADARVDVYSLASTFYEMVCGSRPYKDETIYGLIQSALENKPFPTPAQMRPRLPTGWNRAISKGLAHKPLQRTASVKDFVMELAAEFSRGVEIIRAVAPTLLDEVPSQNQATLVYGADLPTNHCVPPNQSAHRRVLIALLTIFVVSLSATAAAYL